MTSPEQAFQDSLEGQNLYHGRHGDVPAGRATALAILAGLRHRGFELSAISSSSATEPYSVEPTTTAYIEETPFSATETQDGERPGLRCTACHQPEGHDYHKRRGRQWAVPYHPFYAPTPDDRDRIYPCGDPDCEQPKPHTIGPNWHGANTWTIAVPDDRDREVERIAAVLFDLYASPGRKAAPTGDDLRSEAAVLYDAGLRASGGNEG